MGMSDSCVPGMLAAKPSAARAARCFLQMELTVADEQITEGKLADHNDVMQLLTERITHE